MRQLIAGDPGSRIQKRKPQGSRGLHPMNFEHFPLPDTPPTPPILQCFRSLRVAETRKMTSNLIQMQLRKAMDSSSSDLKVSMTFSCYLIILGTIERYLITQRSECLKRFRQSRGLLAFFMFLLSLLLRGTLVFEIQSKIRSATRLLVLIVCSYLLANVLNVLITLWEYVAFQSTQTQEAYVIYEACTDVISVLYVLVCATRLLVYITCNKEIRDAMTQQLCPTYSSKTLKYTKPLDVDQPNRQVGTELDAVAIAIARRLVFSDSPYGDDGDDPESPLQAIVYANDHAPMEKESRKKEKKG
ncbi:hypothetical protein NECAME_10039 [Necator americanus]|uniref:G-protein coupled receptors family 1 profile domain-containing protein n=1 Tax=Necator americanus TaxID=51031 RepID=W2TDJ4_NECAM|nr:hypothetical protein NECAME_10039 [Necator americanus]ETN79092.1 hypothetical protein NECAME_10039 [Necator americanus]